METAQNDPFIVVVPDTLTQLAYSRRIRLFLAGVRSALRIGGRTLFIPMDEDAFARTVLSLLDENQLAYKYRRHIYRGLTHRLPQAFQYDLSIAEKHQLLVRREESDMFCPSLTPAAFAECRNDPRFPEARVFAKRYLQETHRFTSNQEQRYVRARRRLDREWKPYMDGLEAANRITEEDLRITITSPPLPDEE